MEKNRPLTVLLKNIKFAGALKYAYYTQKEIERQIKAALKSSYSFHSEISFNNGRNNFLESIKNNFFSLLMISALKNAGISHGRVREYGKIIFGLRTIITCTDNMIDKEHKGIIFLNSPENAIINNTLLLMIGQDIIRQSLSILEDKKGTVINRLLDNIYSIASSESMRDLDRYKAYPDPTYVSQNIHQGIGGELLALALTSPLYLEDDPLILEKLHLSKNGLFMIGTALQELDDLCDIAEDFFNKKANLALSCLHYNYNYEIGSEAAQIGPENEDFQHFYKDYIKILMEKAFEGFEFLENSGYPLNRKDSSILLKYLFKLRNLEGYWKFYEESSI